MNRLTPADSFRLFTGKLKIDIKDAVGYLRINRFYGQLIGLSVKAEFADLSFMYPCYVMFSNFGTDFI